MATAIRPNSGSGLSAIVRGSNLQGKSDPGGGALLPRTPSGYFWKEETCGFRLFAE